jgi:APA family basic amino acid/polyamine antiporter
VETSVNTKSSTLVRGLGLSASIAVVMGSIIGQGIFLVPSQVARSVGSASWAIAAWLVGGTIVLFATFCYAELGAALPHTGGEYVYLERGLGSHWGFLFGWTSAVLQGPATAAWISAGLLRISAFLFPSVRVAILTWSIPEPFHADPYRFTFTYAQVWAALAIAAVAGINYFGVRKAGYAQILITGIKVAAIIFIIALGFLFKNIGTEARANDAVGLGGAGGFLTALVPVMMAYNGFQYLGKIGGEIADPQRNIPRAAIFAVIVVVILYVLISLIYFRVLGLSQVADSQHVASDTAVRLAGPNGARWLTVLMMLSALGSLHANFLARPRVLYAMARDGRFFSIADRIQPTFRTPSGAILFHTCLAMLLVLTGTFEEIYSLGIFSIWIFVALTAVAVIRLRKKEMMLPRPFRALGYPWTPVMVIAAALAMSANLWLVRPVRSSIGLGVVVLGIPLFYQLRKHAAGSPAVKAPPGGCSS